MEDKGVRNHNAKGRSVAAPLLSLLLCLFFTDYG